MIYRNYTVQVKFFDPGKQPEYMPEKILVTVIDPTNLLTHPTRPVEENIKALFFFELYNNEFVDTPMFRPDAYWRSENGAKSEVSDLEKEMQVQMNEIYGITPDLYSVTVIFENEHAFDAKINQQWNGQ